MTHQHPACVCACSFLHCTPGTSQSGWTLPLIEFFWTMVRYSETHPMYLLFMGTCLGKLCPCHQLCTVLDEPLWLWEHKKFTFMLQVSVRASPPSWKTLTSKEKPLFQLLRKQLHPELTDLSHDFMCQTKCHFHEPIQQYWRFPWRAGVQIHTPPCCTRGPQRT